MSGEFDIYGRDMYCGRGWYWNGRTCRPRNRWHDWGRYVFGGIVIFLFLLFLISCLIISRRRRRRGVQPYYGTGWMAPDPNKPTNQNNFDMNDYNNQQQHQPPQFGYGPPPPPPAYGQQQPQYTGTTFNSNDGYYGHHQGQHTGVQPPQTTYQRDDVYSPPVGPPPGK